MGSSSGGGGRRERVKEKDGTDANKYKLIQICYTIEAGRGVKSMPYWQTQASFLHLMGSKNQVPRMGA
jgi:hypothetical protein